MLARVYKDGLTAYKLNLKLSPFSKSLSDSYTACSVNVGLDNLLMIWSLASVTVASKLTHHTPRPDHGQVKQVAWYRPRYLLQAKKERER